MKRVSNQKVKYYSSVNTPKLHSLQIIHVINVHFKKTKKVTYKNTKKHDTELFTWKNLNTHINISS